MDTIVAYHAYRVYSTRSGATLGEGILARTETEAIVLALRPGDSRVTYDEATDTMHVAPDAPTEAIGTVDDYGTDYDDRVVVHPCATGDDAPLHPLYRQFPKQNNPQPAYVELDPEDGVLCADYSSEIGYAIPEREYHHRLLRWGVCANLTAEEVNDLLARIVPLAVDIIAGYSREWDGNDTVGCYTDEADAARERVNLLCQEQETQSGGVIDLSDWCQGNAHWAAPDLTATTTDEELEAMAEEIERDARLDGQVTVTHVLVTLENWRKQLKDADD